MPGEGTAGGPGGPGLYTLEDFTDTKRQYDDAMPAAAEDLAAKIAHAERAEANIDRTARTLEVVGNLDALDLEAKRRLLAALAVKVTVRSYSDERGKLRDWTADLESYGAAVTALAETVGMFDSPLSCGILGCDNNTY